MSYCAAYIDCDTKDFTGLLPNAETLINLPSELDQLKQQDLSTVDTIIIGENSEANNLLSWLRTQPSTYLLPIFLLKGSHLLADALPNNGDNVVTINKNRIAALPESHASNLIQRICSYLYVDQRRRLKPQQNLQVSKGLEFPLLQLWGNDDNEHVLSWLQQHTAASYLHTCELVNRTRSCKQCDSSALNYIDTCQQCHSINIETERALHCFTCGHIANEAEFQHNLQLSCPNCNTQLRHIGTDYDRPIENIRCNDCNHLSVSSDTRVHCFNCGHDNAIDNLNTNNFYAYQIGLQGISLAQQGGLAPIGNQDISEPVSSQHMAWLIGWLLSAPKPQAESEHYLVKLTVSNYQQLLAQSSELKIAALLDAFIARVTEVLTQDNTKMRIGSEHLLILFPYSSGQALETFATDLSRIASASSDNPIELDAQHHPITEQLNANVSIEEISQWLLAISE